jgi:PucR C-terminal helix-turn-helix domain/GGDEF-like domain
VPGELRSIVDSVGERLRRAVLIEDARFRHEAHSSHHGTVDSVRTASILHRVAPREATDWALTFGISEAQGPVRLPANRELGMDARVCVPIRHQGLLLGYLWLIDAGRTLTEEQLASAGAAGDEAGAVMYRERLLSELARGRERELLRDLLTEDAAVRRHAVDELVEAELFVAESPVAVLVAGAAHPDGLHPDESVRSALAAALEQVRRRSSHRRMLGLVRPDHALVVAAMGDPTWVEGGTAGMAVELLGGGSRPLERSGWHIVVGVGDPRPTLDEVRLSYREALQAARLGHIIPSFGTVVSWSDLGVYQLLSRLAVEELASDALHPGLVRLSGGRDGPRLVETLERYLDSGCDARATAQQLLLHRASLYNRLRRIERVAGIDLRRGEDRLAMHLSLKLARLASVSPNGRPR